MIPNCNIDSGWNPVDKSLELFVLEYCEEVLNIPLYVVANAHYTKEGLEIDLYQLQDEMVREDWYVNLCRISNYAKAS